MSVRQISLAIDILKKQTNKQTKTKQQQQQQQQQKTTTSGKAKRGKEITYLSMAQRYELMSLLPVR